MRKKYVEAGLRQALLVICLLTILTLIITACASSTTSASNTTPTSSSNSPNTVQMNASDFTQSSITIKKGESLTLTNTSSVDHVIENGTWENDTQKPNMEPNAPKVEALIKGGKEQKFTFNTAGTFHLYCTLHPGMNLTVNVQ